MPAESTAEPLHRPLSPTTDETSNKMAPDTTSRREPLPSVPSSNDLKTNDLSIVEASFPAADALPVPHAVLHALQQKHVKIKNLNRTLGKIRKMIEAGSNQLLVISDFDHTMSRAYDEVGERCWTTHGVFDNAASLADLAAKCKQLSAHYMPIEFDGNLTIQEKIPHMEKWWRESHAAIVDKSIPRDVLEHLVLKSNIRLRENAVSVLAHLEKVNVPLVMFSAGIGDIISIFLSQRLGAVPSNMHLISNMMIFDEKNVVSGFREPLIHTFNKNGKVINKNELEFFHKMRQRNSVILMGDSMGDLHMDVGVENHTETDTLKIGFLNKKDHLLPYYLEGYDIVIMDDQSMNIPRSIVDAITAAVTFSS